MSKILVTRSSMPSLEEYIAEIKDIWDSHWLTNMGTKHKELQLKLEKYLEIPHVTLYTNGHLALEGIWELLNFPASCIFLLLIRVFPFPWLHSYYMIFFPFFVS